MGYCSGVLDGKGGGGKTKGEKCLLKQHVEMFFCPHYWGHLTLTIMILMNLLEFQYRLDE